MTGIAPEQIFTPAFCKPNAAKAVGLIPALLRGGELGGELGDGCGWVGLGVGER